MNRNRPVAGPIWYDLPAFDQTVAKSFYGEKFGWTWINSPACPDSVRSSATIGEKHVAAAFTEYPGLRKPDGMLEMDETWGDMLSHFMLYFAVDDCKESVERAEGLVATIHVPPIDIPTGRFGLIENPQGGKFSVITMASDSDET